MLDVAYAVHFFMLHVSEISTMHEMFQIATQGEWINLFISQITRGG